jgi:hypothetical protein
MRGTNIVDVPAMRRAFPPGTTRRRAGSKSGLAGLAVIALMRLIQTDETEILSIDGEVRTPGTYDDFELARARLVACGLMGVAAIAR